MSPARVEPAGSSPEAASALGLVREGWDHLQRQRPLAAWASWQRALRVVPQFPAALEALATLAGATDLPASARGEYRFRGPSDPGRRARWDARFQGRDLTHLPDAAEVFAALARDDPDDAAAWHNLALCFAWLGRNAEAVASLDRVVALEAGAQFESAVLAWTLAEVLRQGGGAEPLADDLRFSWSLDGGLDDAPRLLARGPNLLEAANPLDTVPGDALSRQPRLFEWLDRPLPAASPPLAADDLPRMLAIVVVAPTTLRLSSPVPETLEQVEGTLLEALGAPERAICREATPLPLTLLDADVWTFRRPLGLDPDVEAGVVREALERYYEDRWIHRVRQGLGDRSPLEASRAAERGDVIARARLTAVVGLREQLGVRPLTARLYQGYPFDRLRRRLGLELRDAAAIDAADPSCMSEAELDRLVPEALAVEVLADAYRSAAALGDDRRTARFAAALARNAPDSPAVARVIAPALFATLVREALRAGNRAEAMAWLEKARPSQGGRDRVTYDIWAAEIDARAGDPDAALATYRALLAGSALATAQLLDAVEDLLVNGYDAWAAPLLDAATERGRREGDEAALARAARLAGEALDAPREVGRMTPLGAGTPRTALPEGASGE